jgi:hypothetical protein
MTDRVIERPEMFIGEVGTPHSQQKLQLPPLNIRGDLSRVLMRQELERLMFIEAIAGSVFPLIGVEAEVSEGGYILVLRPIFAPIRQQHFQKEYVLVFFPGEGVIENCFPHLLDECIRKIVGNKFQVKRIYTEKGALSRRSPRILVVIYGFREHKA